MPLVEIARFDDVYEAELAVAFLSANGVFAQVADRGLATIDPLLQRAVGGLRVMAEARDGPRARALLVRARTGEFVEGDDDPVEDNAPGAGAGVALLGALAGGFSGTSRLRRLRGVHWVGLAIIAVLFVLPWLLGLGWSLGLIPAPGS